MLLYRHSVSPVASVVFASTPVTGNARGGAVTINVNNATGMLTKPSYTKIATLSAGCRPAQTFDQMIGYGQGGAWLMLAVLANGDVCVYHKYNSADIVWGSVSASATFSSV